MPVPSHPADALKSHFRKVCVCRGRDFGSPSRGVLGIHDGSEGVQWNAGYRLREGAAWLGVNLEGKKYDDWPVARLIERELSRPLLLTRYRSRVTRPDEVTVRWTRDAWQGRARPPIREANLGPTPNALDRIDGQGWADALRGARECLNPRKQYRGRNKVPVTVLPSERQVEMEVTPHLAIWASLAEITPRAMRQAREVKTWKHSTSSRPTRQDRTVIVAGTDLHRPSPEVPHERRRRMSGKGVTANGQGRTGDPVRHSTSIWWVAATVGLTVVAVLSYHEALRQRVAERWIELSGGIRSVELPETSKAIDDCLEAAFAPVYAAIEPFVARTGGDTAAGLTLSSRTQGAIESGLVGGLEKRLSLAQDSVGRVMRTEMRAELEERFVELEDWFDREVGLLPARPRAGYRRIMLQPIREEAWDLLALTVNPTALRKEMSGVESSVVVRLTSAVSNRLVAAEPDTPAPEPGNAAPERGVPRTAWGAVVGVAKSTMRFVFGTARWVGRFFPGTAIAANGLWVTSELKEWWSERGRRSEALVRDLRTLVDNEKHRTEAAMLRAVDEVKSGALLDSADQPTPLRPQIGHAAPPES